ncbi:hypothetical protein BC829DRAFT_276364 [Chytridium lagenaria]|nr:hypothetical protein BC829DRAFT_276364 [Chytridium lagenaria]
MSMRDQRLFESKPRYSQSAFVEPRTWSNQENMLPSRGVQERRVVAEEYQELHGDNYEENILDELNEPTLMDYQQLRKQKRAYVSEDYDEEFDANSMETERRYQSELALQNKRRKQTTSPKLERSLSSRPKPSNRQPLVRKRAVPLRQKRRGVFGLDDADTYVEVPASSKRKQSDRDIDEEEDIQYSADMTLEDGWLTPASYQRIKRRKEAGSPRGSALSSQKARTPIKAKDDELEEEEKLEEAVPPPTPIVAPVSNSRGRIKIASGTPVKDKEKFSVGTKVPTPIIRKLSSSAMHDLVDKKIESFNDGLLSAPDSDKKKKVTWGENEVSTFASFSSTSSEEKSVEGSSTGASKELPKVSFSFEVPSFTKPAESKAEEAKITEVTSTPAAEKTPAISFGGITSGFGSAPSPAPAAISFGSLPSSSPSSSTAGTSTSAALAASSLFSGLKSDGKKDTVATPPTGAPFNFGSSTSAIPSEATAPSLSSSGFKPNEQKSVAAGPATLAPPAFGGGFSFSSTPAASAPGTSAPTAPALSASINLATTSSTSSTGPVALPSFGGAASAASSASGGSGGFTVSSQPSSTNFGSLTPAAPAEAPKSSVPASQPASSGLTFNFGGNTSSAPSAAPAPISLVLRQHQLLPSLLVLLPHRLLLFPLALLLPLLGQFL